MDRIANILAVVLGFLLVLCGSFAALREGGTLAYLRDAESTRSAALAGAGPAQPLSLSSQSALLSDCRSLVFSLTTLRLEKSARTQVQRDCYARDVAITASSPALGLGWLSRAEISAAMGDADAFASELEMAWRVAPNESWLGARRLDLLERWDLTIGQRGEDIEASDILLLLQSLDRYRDVAALYVSRPAVRDRITALAEKLPENVQSRFLSAVKVAAKAQARRPN